MKTLIVFYSRTGTSRKVALQLQKLMKADIEEIIDTKDRSGPMGYLTAGKEATLKKLTKIKPIQKNLEKYNLIIIGTPVWAYTMSSPVRTFLTENKFKNKIAFFCTMDGSGDERTFKHMEELSKKPEATLTLLTKEVHQGSIEKQLKEFGRKVK